MPFWPFRRRPRLSEEEIARRLDDFATRLRALARPATRLLPRQLDDDEELPPTATRCGGVPYLEAGEAWPICGGCGAPLEHIAQVDLRACHGRPTHAFDLLTFFYCWSCFPWGDEEDESAPSWLVRTYRDPRDEKAVPVEPPEEAETDTWAVDLQPVELVPFWDALHVRAPELAAEIDAAEAPIGDVHEVLHDRLASSLLPEGQASCVGGHPSWVQGDDTPTTADGRRYELLVQLDSEPVTGWMWGDAGIAYLFVDPESGRIALRVQCH